MVKMNIALGILNSFDFVNKDFSVAIGNLAVGDELPYFIIMLLFKTWSFKLWIFWIVKFLQHINSKKGYVLFVIPNFVYYDSENHYLNLVLD